MADSNKRHDERRAAADEGDEYAQMKLRRARIRSGEEQVPTRTYRVMELNLTGLRKKVASYARRATKLGVFPLELHVSDERFMEPRGDVVLPARDVTITGDQPDLGDWRLVARLEHLKTETVIHHFGTAVQGVEAFRERGPVCDHCKVRRQRRDTFAVLNSVSGELIQVGRSCLEDFCGSNPKGALYLFDADVSLHGLAASGHKILETCKHCKEEVTPVVTLATPHGVCPHCDNELEGKAIRSAAVPTARLLISFADDGINGNWNHWNKWCVATNPEHFKTWTPERLAEAGAMAMKVVAWAQTADDNEGAVLRDQFVEWRHIDHAVRGFNRARMAITCEERGVSGELVEVQFARLRRLGTWGISGPNLVVGQEVVSIQKSGFRDHKIVEEIIHTASDGTTFATFRNA